jgi:uncharacterized protein YukE
MPPETACLNPSPLALTALDSAAQQLRRIGQRIVETGTVARHAAAETDWQTPAARAFHSSAQRLAEDVFALSQILEAVLGEIALAHARVSVENSWDCR